ncbi:MAG: class I SAM-dependent methyltransferase [Planctomycetes bacterium]|nr:class I SAM-dependent methyltransferase [Planctomycetota bacterium]
MPDSETEADWEQNLDRIFEGTTRAIRRYHPEGGDLLDVGAGFGGFLVRAAQDGWRLHGVEPNAAAFAVMRKRLGDRASLQQSIFETADLEPQSYDGIVMMNVIEHIREPLEYCRRAYDLLRPGGFLGLRWPQMSAKNLLRERIKGSQDSDRVVIGAPIHLHDYTRHSMEKLLENSGYCDIRHAWAGTRRLPNLSLKSRFAAELATIVAKSSHYLTGGRKITPFIARLSLGRKPVA